MAPTLIDPRETMMSASDKSHDKPARETSETSEENSSTQDSAQRLVQQAEPFLKLETEAATSIDDAAPAAPFRFAELSQKVCLAAGTGPASGVEIQVQLGQTQLNARELREFEPGSLLTLNELASEPVEILAAGQVIARAEVVMFGDEPAVRIVEVV